MIRDENVEHCIARARELRAQAFANLMRQAWVGVKQLARRITFLKKLADWFRNLERRERDAFLSQATDHSDLDRRIRVWENHERRRPFFDYFDYGAS